MPRVKLQIHTVWWKEIGHIPQIGSFIMPFESDNELDVDVGFEDFEVVRHLYLAELDLVVVQTETDPRVRFCEGFKTCMRNAGWSDDEDGVWE